MIVKACLHLVLFIMRLLTKAMPEVCIPIELMQGLGKFFEVMLKWNRYFPIVETFWCIGAYMSVMLMYYSLFVVHRAYKECKSLIPLT